MRKFIITLVALLCFSLMSAQTIDDWIAVASVANVHKKEKEHLDKMKLKQAALVAPTTALSSAAALTIKTEHRLHKGLAHVYNLIDNAEIILLLVKHSKDIIEVQDAIYGFVQDKPDIAPIAAFYEVQYLKRTTDAMVKLIMAIKESRLNIMKNKQRLDLLYGAADTLKLIRDDSFKLYSFIEYLHKLGGINIDTVPILIDLDGIVAEMKNEIETILKL